MVTLGLDDDELSSCVSCGLCLPHCPTFRVTGDEALSPRGRIATMRSLEWDAAPVTSDVLDALETCVQCRGCEPACPSGVPFGHLMEGTRSVLAGQRIITPRWQRWAYAILPHSRVLHAGTRLIALAQRLHLVPRRLGLPRLGLGFPSPIHATGGDVWLYTGCVMDAWLRETHRSVAKVLDALGVAYALPGTGGGCCGALHVHAGLRPEARRLALDVMASMPGDAPILVDSAGCGAAMKDYGREFGTDEARAFSARVLDIHEFVAQHLEELGPLTRRVDPVVVQDPCHLRHVQREHQHVRAVIGAVADVVELDDDGLCCGAGGSYSALQPTLAAQIRDRKVTVIERAVTLSGASVVASANPGCAMHLGAVLDLPVRHPMDLLAEALA